MFISLPHFLNADDDIKNSIDGLKADESIHTTYLNIEPYTGNVDEDIRTSIDGLKADPFNISQHGAIYR